MFKEEYKKYYDEIHPSQELVERTKKLALEQYRNRLSESENDEWKEEHKEEESYETEKVEYTEEEKIIFLGMGKRKILQIAGGLAAGFALITVGYLFSGTLKQQADNVGTVVENTIEPTGEKISSSNMPSKLEEEYKGEEKKNSGKKKEKKEDEKPSTKTTNSLSTLAKMANGDGVRLDYAAGDLVIFHGNFGILGYSLSSQKIVVQIPKERYQFPDMWSGEVVRVNQEGTKIGWYGAASSNTRMEVYDISTGKYSQTDKTKWQEEYQEFQGVVSVVGTAADIYSSKATDMCVNLSESKVCQMIYQAPALSLQASLSIAIVDTGTKEEQIYDVFGSVGRQVAESYGITYGGFHKEDGTSEQKPEGTECPEKTPQPETEPTESVVETETPVEVTPTPVPEPTENPEKPEESESPQKVTQNIETKES